MHELIGADVVEVDGTASGSCVAVVANPAADLLELDAGALVPVVFVTSSSPTASITIDPPPGLFDDELTGGPLRIDVFTHLPRRRRRVLLGSLLGKARPTGLLDLRCHDLREHTTDVHRTVDDAPFGGGAGMLMKPEPIFAAVEAAAPPRPLCCSVPAAAGSTRPWPPSSPPATGSACCAAATRASTTASASTSSTAS